VHDIPDPAKAIDQQIGALHTVTARQR
jgi:hypothetical protein